MISTIIKNLYWFSIALRLKNFWSVLKNNGLWHRVLTKKYMKHISMVAWLRGKCFCTRGVSIIWRGFLQTLPWLGCHLSWQVGNGNDILIGIDPIIGVPSSLSLPDDLRTFLEDLDINTLSQARNTLPDSQHYWYSAEDLCIDGVWKDAWDAYTRGLHLCGIHLTAQPDTLLWDFNKQDGSISAKLVYDCIVKSFPPSFGSRLHTYLWSSTLPSKIGCFIWLALRNKILTWDNLQKRGWFGPGICALCNADEESVMYIFSHCTV